MERIRAALLDASRAIVPLMRDPAVATRWHEPSALQLLSIGGVTGHLVRATCR